jgi:hypothetical protein
LTAKLRCSDDCQYQKSIRQQIHSDHAGLLSDNHQAVCYSNDPHADNSFLEAHLGEV